VEIGDFVIGLPPSSFIYQHTNEHTVCEVVGIENENKIIIKIISFADPSVEWRNTSALVKDWIVEKKYFRRLNNAEIREFLAWRV